MARRDLSSALAFSAVAALALVAVIHALAPRFGSAGAVQLHWAACLVAWAICSARDARGAIRQGLAAGLGAACVLALARDTASVAVGLTLVLGVVRSGLGGRRPLARAIWLEVVFGAISLGFAAWLAGPGWLGQALGLWGFGLVQSGMALAPDPLGSAGRAGGGDPFERAHDALARLLDDDPLAGA